MEGLLIVLRCIMTPQFDNSVSLEILREPLVQMYHPFPVIGGFLFMILTLKHLQLVAPKNYDVLIVYIYTCSTWRVQHDRDEF